MYELDEMLAYLKVYGQEIGDGARRGEKLCLNIVAAYTLAHKRAEPGALGVLGAGLDMYKQRVVARAQEAGND